MHNELRYQAKIHAISEKLSKERNKVPHLLPIFFIFFLLKNETEKKKNNKDMLMEKEMTSNPSM
jgi:hypothetical protein